MSRQNFREMRVVSKSSNVTYFFQVQAVLENEAIKVMNKFVSVENSYVNFLRRKKNVIHNI